MIFYCKECGGGIVNRVDCQLCGWSPCSLLDLSKVSLVKKGKRMNENIYLTADKLERLGCAGHEIKHAMRNSHAPVPLTEDVVRGHFDEKGYVTCFLRRIFDQTVVDEYLRCLRGGANPHEQTELFWHILTTYELNPKAKEILEGKMSTTTEHRADAQSVREKWESVEYASKSKNCFDVAKPGFKMPGGEHAYHWESCAFCVRIGTGGSHNSDTCAPCPWFKANGHTCVTEYNEALELKSPTPMILGAEKALACAQALPDDKPEFSVGARVVHKDSDKVMVEMKVGSELWVKMVVNEMPTPKDKHATISPFDIDLGGGVFDGLWMNEDEFNALCKKAKP